VDKNRNQTLQRTIIVVIVILFITALFFLLVDVNEVLQQLVSADARYLIAASLALVLGLVAFAARWRALLEYKPPLLFTFHASNMGHAGNMLIPFRAGEAIRILVMGSSQIVSFTSATTSVVVERLFEQLMRFVVLGLAIAVGVGLEVTPTTLLGGLGLLIFGFGAVGWLVNHPDFTRSKGTQLLAKLPRVTKETAHQSVSDLLQNLAAVSKPRQFIQILLLSGITWLLFWGFFYVTLLALDTTFLPQQRLAISLAALALSPPSAPTQPGIFHASIVVPIAALGFDPETLTAYAVILQAIEMFWMIGLALWGLLATGSSLSIFFLQKK
jgi:uncharacterized protein (TIRG00374 family)